MDETTQQDLKKQFQALPVELQKAIVSIDLPTKLQEIIKNNKLMLDQAGNLETEIQLVLLGVEPLDNFIKNLVNNVGLSNIQASIIAHDVNELVFKGIREALKTINDQILEEEKQSKEIPQLTKKDVLVGIEKPHILDEESVSLSSLPSNKPEIHEAIDRGVEIKINNLPEIPPKIEFPVVQNIPVTVQNQSQPANLNISVAPTKNIIETKLNETVVIPKQTIVIEEKTKLPGKDNPNVDPYRESFI